MFRHVVSFRFKESEKTKIKEAKEKLLLLAKIPVVKNVEVGIDETSGERSYDIVLIVDLDNRDDLDVYDKHELHNPVRMFMQNLYDVVVTVDYHRDND